MGIPQGPLLAPLLFSIHMKDLGNLNHYSILTAIALVLIEDKLQKRLSKNSKATSQWLVGNLIIVKPMKAKCV